MQEEMKQYVLQMMPPGTLPQENECQITNLQMSDRQISNKQIADRHMPDRQISNSAVNSAMHIPQPTRQIAPNAPPLPTRPLSSPPPVPHNSFKNGKDHPSLQYAGSNTSPPPGTPKSKVISPELDGQVKERRTSDRQASEYQPSASERSTTSHTVTDTMTCSIASETGSASQPHSKCKSPPLAAASSNEPQVNCGQEDGTQATVPPANIVQQASKKCKSCDRSLVHPTVSRDSIGVQANCNPALQVDSLLNLTSFLNFALSVSCLFGYFLLASTNCLSDNNLPSLANSGPLKNNWEIL